MITIENFSEWDEDLSLNCITGKPDVAGKVPP